MHPFPGMRFSSKATEVPSFTVYGIPVHSFPWRKPNHQQKFITLVQCQVLLAEHHNHGRFVLWGLIELEYSSCPSRHSREKSKIPFCYLVLFRINPETGFSALKGTLTTKYHEVHLECFLGFCLFCSKKHSNSFCVGNMKTCLALRILELLILLAEGTSDNSCISINISFVPHVGAWNIKIPITYLSNQS